MNGHVTEKLLVCFSVRALLCFVLSQSFRNMYYWTKISDFLKLPSFSITQWFSRLLPFFSNCQSSHYLFIYNLKLQFKNSIQFFLKSAGDLKKSIKSWFLKCFTQSASLPHFLGMDQNSVNYKICSCVTSGTSVSGICFSSSVCPLLWHGAEQFIVSLNGLSVVFIWTFSPVLYFWFFGFFFCLCFWGILVTNFLISNYSGSVEMGYCKIRALDLFSFCVIWNSALSTYQVLRPIT